MESNLSRLVAEVAAVFFRAKLQPLGISPETWWRAFP